MRGPKSKQWELILPTQTGWYWFDGIILSEKTYGMLLVVEIEPVEVILDKGTFCVRVMGEPENIPLRLFTGKWLGPMRKPRS